MVLAVEAVKPTGKARCGLTSLTVRPKKVSNMNLRANFDGTAPSPMVANRPPISPVTRLLYGVGSLAFGIKDNGFNVLLLLYYNQVMGLSARLVGTIAMVALLLDAFIDPIIGHISDRWRSAWGRRHPFMYVAAVPAGLTYLLLWNAPSNWSHAALAIYLLVTIIVVRSFLALYEIPSSALAAELSNDYDIRTGLLSYRTFFAWFGGVSMAFVAFIVFLRPDSDHPVGQLNPDGYANYGVVASVIMCVAILVSAAGTQRQIPWLQQPGHRAGGIVAALREMAGSFSNRAFLVLLAAGVCSAMAAGIQITLSTYFNTYFWGFNSDQLSVLMLGVLVASALGAVAAPRLSRRFGKKRSAIALWLLSIVFYYCPFVLRLSDCFPANGSPLLLPVLLVTITISLTLIVSSSILTASMLADVSEESELSTGRRSEGLFFSANTFAQKCVSGVGLFTSGMILTLVHFPEEAVPGQVSEEVLRDLALTALPIQAALYLLSIGLIAAFPITRAAHEANLARLASRRSVAARPASQQSSHRN